MVDVARETKKKLIKKVKNARPLVYPLITEINKKKRRTFHCLFKINQSFSHKPFIVFHLLTSLIIIDRLLLFQQRDPKSFLLKKLFDWLELPHHNYSFF